ncbi:hypothetical protein GCM10010339_88780 [Streptomyces alanosinicus]|uniref:Uncharacterized protein n=1 Tax=Streptomyces alanosinicus TaxID=68171 RepID=A0A919D9A7_9ACTN|nr:hypothetical protein GCM10010339_88780 [Streptomyces alanosinicus]
MCRTSWPTCTPSPYGARQRAIAYDAVAGAHGLNARRPNCGNQCRGGGILIGDDWAA